jgi:hypothetical protein
VTVLGWLTVLIVWSVVGSVSLVLSLVMTNPLALGPVGVTIWFVLLFLVLASIWALGLYAAKVYLRLHASGAGRLRYSWRQGLLVSAWLVSLLALSSLRQLGVLDAILLGILLVIVEVYVRFRWP